MCINILKNKWKSFEPTKQYLSIVSGLTSIIKLHNYLLQFVWQGEKGDHWKTPWEFIENKDGNNDCEDFARFAVDVLVRVIGTINARFIVHSGYDKKRWGNKTVYHAITVLPYNGKLALFSNNEFKTGYKDFIETGYYTFPDGLKYMEVRDWQGKILSKRRQWFGTF